MRETRQTFQPKPGRAEILRQVRRMMRYLNPAELRLLRGEIDAELAARGAGKKGASKAEREHLKATLAPKVAASPLEEASP